MGKHHGIAVRDPQGYRRAPRHTRAPNDDPADVKRERVINRISANWRIKAIDGEVLALEPGCEHEQVFTEGADPYWAAVEFAAACLRGETDPATLS